MTFSEPWILLAAPAVLLLVVLGSARLAARRRRLAEFLGGRRAAARLGRSGLYRLPVGRTVLLGLAALFLAAAAAGPDWRSDRDAAPPIPEELPPPSVVLALDISASMQAQDGNPTRLARAAEVARDFLATLEDGRVGLLLFSGTPYMLAPPTRDHEVLEYLLDGVTPDLVNIYDPGSLPSAALAEATRRLAGSPPDSTAVAGAERTERAEGPSPEPGRRSIVLIGDGGAGEPVAAIREAAAAAVEEGIRVHTVGVGTPEGGRMLLPAGYTPKGPDGRGARGPLVTRLDPATLRQLAQAGNGLYAHAEDASELDRIHRVLSSPSREPAPEAEGPLWARTDPATVLLLLALLTLMAEGLLDLPARRSRRVRPWSSGPVGAPTGAAVRATGRTS